MTVKPNRGYDGSFAALQPMLEEQQRHCKVLEGIVHMSEQYCPVLDTPDGGN